MYSAQKLPSVKRIGKDINPITGYNTQNITTLDQKNKINYLLTYKMMYYFTWKTIFDHQKNALFTS